MQNELQLGDPASPAEVIHPLASEARQEMISGFGRLAQSLGLPRSMGQIYGLLYLSTKPLTLDDLVRLLSLSKGSASTGTRQLSSWGAVKQVWVPGDRRLYFEAVRDLGDLLRGAYRDFVRPRFAASERRMRDIKILMNKDLAEGRLTQEEYDFCNDRVGHLSVFQSKLAGLAPMAESFLG